MQCPICDGRTRVVEGRSPAFLRENRRREVDLALLEELGLDPCYVRWRKCTRCEWRFVTVEVPWRNAVAL
jgi:transcriptional regulator NrdR family protein